MSSQLNKREPDMQPAVKPRSSSVTFFGIAGRTLSALIAFCRGGSLPTLVSSRRFIAVALRGASLPERRKPKMASPVRGTIELEARPVGSGGLALLLVSVSFSLLIISGITITILFMKIKDMKIEIVQWKQSVLATRARLNQVEKIEKERTIKKTSISGTQSIHTPISLAKADMQVIREFIKVVPPEPGASQKIHLGDKISVMASAPVPEPLVDQMTKLRGARFLIDQNGAIIISGEGSNRADAIIAPN